MRRHITCAAVATALLTITAPAFAAEKALGGDERSGWPTELTRRPLTLGAGMVEVWAPVQLNASEDADWEPVTLNPSLNIGITDTWQVGIRHLVGICVGEAEDGCPVVYNDVGFTTRVSLGRGAGLDIALQGAFNIAPLRESARAYSAEAGLLFRAGGGAVALTLEPTVGFGLNDRDTRVSRTSPILWNLGTYDVVTATETVGNREQLMLPATLQLQLGPALALAAGIALEGPLNPEIGDFSDFYRIPAGAAVLFTVMPNLDLGASLTFPALLGENDDTDLRQLAAFVAFRI
jgi:hypothetical protein